MGILCSKPKLNTSGIHRISHNGTMGHIYNTTVILYYRYAVEVLITSSNYAHVFVCGWFDLVHMGDMRHIYDVGFIVFH